MSAFSASVTIYGHQDRPLIRTLPRLLEKVLETEERATVLVPQDLLEVVDKGLWTYTPLGFLPHGKKREGVSGDPSLQPIWLTSVFENPNNAGVLVVFDYQVVAEKDLLAGAFTRILDLFSLSDKSSVTHFCKRLDVYRALHADMVMWKDEGSWNKAQELLQSF
ncbi:MAG: DNA polymerase III subunit chi [Alphaproteobacteria bacterium]|nr:MAG: DNA polymerase III subunit chi [Alphaproteobacteria bacterium]